MRKNSLHFSTMWIAYLLISFYISNSFANPKVLLPNGATVIGIEDRTVGKNISYHSYRGIPYAEPPIGDLRFKSPVPLQGNFTNKIIDATNYGSYCVQLFPYNKQVSLVYGSEDCLKLNVYVPQKDSSKLLSVIVFVHGGYLLRGDSSEYPPDFLLDEDLIFVGINYRIGIFGFLSTGDAASPGNYGVKDQLLALRWVQQNIEAFGGNKSSVTLYGESHGAITVSYLTQSPLSYGLYHKVILSSGSSLCTWGLTKHNLNMAFVVGRLLGIHTKNTTELVEKLRLVDYNKLQSAANAIIIVHAVIYNMINHFPFSATMEPNLPGAIITEPLHEGLKQGHFNQVPYLIGFNSRESTFPGDKITKHLKSISLVYIFDPILVIPEGLSMRNFFERVKISEKILEHYLKNNTIYDAAEEFAADHLFIRPIVEHVNLISRQVPVYLYNFSYEGYLGNPNRKEPGTGHSEDLNYVFNFDANPKNLSLEDRTVRYRLLRLLSNFAKYSNPTPAIDSLLQNITWIASDTSIPNTVNIFNIGKNLNNMLEYNVPNLRFWSEIYEKYGNPPYTTY